MPARRLTARNVEATIKATSGNVYEAAKRLGVARSTLYYFMEARPALKQLLEDEREALVDLSETVVKAHLIQQSLPAAIFVLDRKGHSRGYVKRQELTGADGGPVRVQDVPPDGKTAATEAAELLAKLKGRGKGLPVAQLPEPSEN